jgi:hypothetical protein
MPFPGVVCGVVAGGDTTLTGGLLEAGGLVAVPDEELPPLAEPELAPAEPDPTDPDPAEPDPTDPEPELPEPFGAAFPGFIGRAGSGRGVTWTVCWARVRPASSRAVKVPKVAGDVNVPPG